MELGWRMTYRSRLTVSVSGPNVMMVLRLNRDLGMDALWYIVTFYVQRRYIGCAL